MLRVSHSHLLLHSGERPCENLKRSFQSSWGDIILVENLTLPTDRVNLITLHELVIFK